jgi:predicted dienelactone hydrolase
MPEQHSRRSIPRRVLIGLISLLALAAPPARALEVLEVRIPLLDTSLEIRLNELTDAASLWQGNSDLAELDRATDGALGRKIIRFLNDPLPISSVARESLSKAAGSPLLQQALMALSFLVDLDVRPETYDGSRLLAALEEAERQGPVTVLSLLRAFPATRVSLDLEKASYLVDQQQRQRRRATALLASRSPATADPARLAAGPAVPLRRVQHLDVSHRAEPLELVTLQPGSQGNGRLVVISHGLWDSPESFEGWAAHLASHGYSVLLPVHPGSDETHQQAMLSGREPPPSPEELRYRPLDVTAVLDAVATGRIEAGVPRKGPVVVIGHSWGGTTALQLAGLRPSSGRLRQRCSDLRDPLRNPSWLLQCSFLSAADQASLGDPRVIAVVAVSPPMHLLFDDGASRDMNGRVLVVSGSQDWVVPPDPEAILPFSSQRQDHGHQLVLVQGGDHFNLRAEAGSDGGVLRPLLLAWVEAAFRSPEEARPRVRAPHLLPEKGWGHPEVRLVEATPRL